MDRGAGVCRAGCRRLWIGVQTSVDQGVECRPLWIGVQESVERGTGVCG